MTWQDVLDRKDDFIGGDFSSVEDEGTVRGRISDIKINREEMFVVEGAWFAESTDSGWQNFEPDLMIVGGKPGVSVLTSVSSPLDVGSGKIQFTIPLVGVVTLFPKGSPENLDPSEVEGLEVPA